MMKSTLLVLSAVFAFSALAQTSSVEIPQAASTSTAQIPETEAARTISAKGIRAGLWVPSLSTKIGNERSRRMDRTVGVTIGYANLPVRSLGWTVNAGLFEMTDYMRGVNSMATEDSAAFAKLDLSLAYAINSYFNVKAGANVSGFTQQDGRDVFEPDLGYQAGLGVQLTRHIGIEAGVLTMSQNGIEERQAQDFKAEGYDFGITGTF
jgi:hypothetical protein